MSPSSIDSPIGLVNAFFRKYYPASAQHATLQIFLILSRLKERKCLKHSQGFALYLELDLDISCPKMNFLIFTIMD